MSRTDAVVKAARVEGTLRQTEVDGVKYYPAVDLARLYTEEAIDQTLVQKVLESFRKKRNWMGPKKLNFGPHPSGHPRGDLSVVSAGTAGEFRDQLVEEYERVQKEKAAAPVALPLIAGTSAVSFAEGVASKTVDEGFPIVLKIGNKERTFTRQAELDVYSGKLTEYVTGNVLALRNAQRVSEEKDQEILLLRQEVARLQAENVKLRACDFASLLDLVIEEELRSAQGVSA